MTLNNQNKNSRRNKEQIALMASLWMEMLVIIGLFTWGGIKLDQWIGTTKPYFAASCIFFSVLLSIFYAFKRINKKQK